MFTYAGFLKGKTVILVTHQLQFLSAAEHIVLLDNVRFFPDLSKFNLKN